MDTIDPYKPPSTLDADAPYSASAVNEPKPLGSLAQSARGKELRQARVILIVVGVLTVAANAFLLFNLPKEVQAAIRENNVGPDQEANYRHVVTLFGYGLYGSAAAVGLLFVIFGVIVQKFPVPITITSLVLYITMAAIFGYLNPMSLAQGIIVKILIVIALFRAIKAARAYKSHTDKAAVTDELLA